MRIPPIIPLTVLMLISASLQAKLVPGTTVALRSSNGKFVSSENGTKAMNCNRNSIGAWEKFVVVDRGNGKVALRGNNGLYVSSENGTKPMNCNRATPAAWETFTPTVAGGGRVGLQASNGQYVTSNNGTREMISNRASEDLWEWFTPVIVSGGQTISADSEIAAVGGNVIQGLRNAIAKAGAGGTVSITGNYSTSGRITIIEEAGLTITGGGTLTTTASPLSSIFVIKDAAGVTFDNINLSGPSNFNNLSGYAALISLTGSADTTVRNLTLRNARMGIYGAFQPSYNLTIQNVVFDNCGEAYVFGRDVVRINSTNRMLAALNGGRTVITNCTVKGIHVGAGFRFDGGNDGIYTNATIEPNNPLRTQIDGKQTEMLSEQGWRSQIRGCTIGETNNPNAGISSFGIGLALHEGMYIGGPNASDSNTITMGGLNKAQQNFSHCIHFEHNAKDVLIENNTLNSRQRPAISMVGFSDHGSPGGPQYGAELIEIRNNRMYGDSSATSARGITGTEFHQVSIINNTMTGYDSGKYYGFWGLPSDAFKSVYGNSPYNP
ncbi:hypothetical protein [Coraliomargarita akajimensis]|uniref:Right handed beta helix domain-containing protein n=1 Tax=Coraliomargarita akajimensis (strain DSM 45221 / IAM 15411 / JCM 23193 / KCTC 12865 / 04OKA010-24) TaxID=583355 RepID=D5EIK8_CORAD|nr:hypothetical protein [Coraliomargarita akajimensis]ADE54274.1 hypothetical protein Caka_1254 [Coraliomargarita akajimensis DSM 45221]